MRKIPPLKARTADAAKEVYQHLYGEVDEFIAEKLKWRGIHTLIQHRLGTIVPGARVLDLGCSFGRFSLLAERSGASTLGLDMIPRAVDVARTLARAVGARRAVFECREAETFRNDGPPFDVAILALVLEQLIDPDVAMRSVAAALRPGGQLVIASTNESNYRGDVTEVLARLFGFPMTLADLRVVPHEYVVALAARHGFTLEETIGCCYQRAWGILGGEDLKRRVSRVLEDVQPRVTAADVDMTAFGEWVDRRIREQEALLDDWIARGVLCPIPARRSFTIDSDVIRAAGLNVGPIRDYLAPDFGLDPHYCTEPPYSRMGGLTVYLLRRN